ncbi:segregation/condensation protein A [Isobaculum melis]|uniref:Segregation and condensation protein A n=1 Tax=Isobaculum melis TaxID=142588 RepID=A0A1H9R7A4_9LACT|nr:segregation/condensation protein A [Isobaculum melis]SER68624.1 condensin subunit ScpA [Isobaculum melis]
MAEIHLKMDAFEGPLDLLLHLIQKLELDIYDIPVAEVTEQYMAYIHAMKELQLDIASDYLVMAATLLAIKSKMLLPKQELAIDEEDEGYFETGDDPREALVEQLLEYRKYKYAADELKEREETRSQYYTKAPADLHEWQQNVPLNPLQLTTSDIFLAFSQMLHRKKLNQPLQTKIALQEVTIEEKMADILAIIRKKNGEKIDFQTFFEVATKSEMVTTFLAVLELMKAKSIWIEQKEVFGELWVYEGAMHVVE